MKNGRQDRIAETLTYLKSVEKKASIRITIRKEKENECE